MSLTIAALALATACTGATSTGSTTGTQRSAAPSVSASANTGGRASTGGATTAGTATGGATTAGATGGAASGGATGEACSLISSTEAQQAVGNITVAPSAKSGTLPGSSAQGQLCVYEGADGTMTVGVLEHVADGDFSGFATSLPGVQELQGLGDKAFLAKGSPSGSAAGATVLVLKGGTYLSISATSTKLSADDLADALRDIAKTAADEL